MCSGAGRHDRLVRGSPIRTPSDQRSVGSSPRLIAASHVLHRLLVPRHPPCALNNLTNTLFVLDKTPPIHRRTGACAGHKRCSRPLCSSQRPTGAPPRPPPPAPPPPPRGGGGEPM